VNLSLSFEPLVPWLWLALLAVPLVAVAVAILLLRQRGSMLRAIAIAALLAAIANPVIVDERREPLKSVAAIVVDRSPSQDLANRRSETDAAVAELQRKLARFPQFEVRTVETGRSSKIEEQVETRLFDALGQAFRDVPPSRAAGAILVTDGQVHDIPQNGNGGIGAPLHSLITGRPEERDRRIFFERAPRFGITGKPLDFAYRVTDTGGNGTVEVRVSVNGKTISTETAAIGEQMPLSLTLETAGKNIVEIQVDEIEGEITAANNRSIASVDGIRENLRVLLVSGEPHSGERTWRNLLKSDASVDLVHFTILRPPEKQDGTPINELSLIAFPTRELFVEKIADFDLIIFDRYQHRDVLPVLYYDYIAEYVKNGGALLIAAGPEYASEESIARTPLMAALPALPDGNIAEKAFYPRLTDAGKRHPVTRQLEGGESEPPKWSRWFRAIGIAQAQGNVVMKAADEAPLLLLNRYGDGRVAMLLSDQGWLWARGFEGGGPHVSLYRHIAHWLMREPELEEERLTADGTGMALAITRQTMGDEAGNATIVAPTGARREVSLAAREPGRFTATLDVDQIGLYQIANGELTALAHVGPINAPEFTATVSTTEPLAVPAKTSGGAVMRLFDTADDTSLSVPSILPVTRSANAFGRDWLGLRETDETILRGVSRIPLFGGLLGLAALIVALGAMWYREGRS
jgi:hypothetical protein